MSRQQPCLREEFAEERKFLTCYRQASDEQVAQAMALLTEPLTEEQERIIRAVLGGEYAKNHRRGIKDLWDTADLIVIAVSCTCDIPTPDRLCPTCGNTGRVGADGKYTPLGDYPCPTCHGSEKPDSTLDDEEE